MWLQCLQGNPLSSENDIFKASLIFRIKLRPQAGRASLAVQECSCVAQSSFWTQTESKSSQTAQTEARKCCVEILPSRAQQRFPVVLQHSPKISEQAALALFISMKKEGMTQGLAGNKILVCHPGSTWWGNPCGHNTGGSMSGLLLRIPYLSQPLISVSLEWSWKGKGPHSLRKCFDLWDKGREGTWGCSVVYYSFLKSRIFTESLVLFCFVFFFCDVERN